MYTGLVYSLTQYYNSKNLCNFFPWEQVSVPFPSTFIPTSSHSHSPESYSHSHGIPTGDPISVVISTACSIGSRWLLDSDESPPRPSHHRIKPLS